MLDSRRNNLVKPFICMILLPVDGPQRPGQGRQDSYDRGGDSPVRCVENSRLNRTRLSDPDGRFLVARFLLDGPRTAPFLSVQIELRRNAPWPHGASKSVTKTKTTESCRRSKRKIVVLQIVQLAS